MSLALLAGAFDRLPDPAIILALADGRPVAANAAFAAATALTRHEVVEADGQRAAWRPDPKGWRPLVRALGAVSVVKAPHLALILGDERVEMPDVRLERFEVDGEPFVLVTSRSAAMSPATRITPIPEPPPEDAGADEVARLRAIIDTVAGWIAVTDRDGQVELWNETARRETGFEKSETIAGRKLWELLFPDPARRAGILSRLRSVIERGENVDGFETIVARADGSTCRASWKTRQLLDERGEPAGMVALGRDVSRERKTLRKLRADLEATLWLLDGARELLCSRDERILCRLAARRVRGLYPGAALVFVERIDEKADETALMAVGGTPREKSFVASVIAQDLAALELTGTVPPSRAEELRQGRLTRGLGELDDVFDGLLSPEVARTLAGYTGADEARRIGVVVGGELLGAITILGRDGPAGSHRSRIETYAGCLARALAAGSGSVEGAVSC